MTHKLRWRFLEFFCVLAMITPMAWPGSVSASCGAASCFVVIGAQQQVPMAGLLTVNAIYNYTPSWTAAGQGGDIPFADQENHRLTLSSLNSSQIWTHVQIATLDMNYGVTDRFGLQVTLPYKRISSEANLGIATPVPWTDQGMGDMRVTMKYNLLPTLRSMIVLGLGVDFPTGTYQQRASTGQMVESTQQLGRGNFGLAPSLYQTYEIVPHRI
ncbi:MAG: transporter, partial [Nitrospiraceae bacterium]